VTRPPLSEMRPVPRRGQPRDRSTFRQGDLTKAFKAAKKAGVDVRVEIDLECRRMTITPVNTSDAGDEAITAKNDWDSIYDQN
jgi:hypothetical protein